MNFRITEMVEEKVLVKKVTDFNLYTYIGYKLDLAREAKGIKNIAQLHNQLCEKYGSDAIAETTVRKIFAGDNASVRVSYLVMMSEHLEISFGSLFPQEFLDGNATKGTTNVVPEWEENNAVT